MNFNKTLITLFLASLLSACGGNDGSGGFFGADGNTPSDPPDDPTDPVVTPVDLALGTGSGGAFIDGAMNNGLAVGAELAFAGSTSITVNIVNASNNALYTAAPVTVTFSSSCVLAGTSTITSSVISTTGTASATYEASTCEGTDTLRATLPDGSSATTNITIADRDLGDLTFVSATPSTIALQGNGTSALPASSTIKFLLVDPSSQPIQGETVQFTLSTTAGGITFANGLSTSSSVTAADGTASVVLNAGLVPISVNVSAVVTDDEGNTRSTTSLPLAIVGAVPDQDSFSISVSTFNPRGWDRNGTTSSINIHAADRNNNPAPNGTQILFRTSGGVIVGNCQLAGGACSVNWTSQDPRPEEGLVQILARTVGEESFRDTNSNGLYDVGESILTPLAEAYLDEDGDETYDSGEFFSDFIRNGAYNGTPDALYQGNACSDEARTAGHCANLVEVRQTATLCMSSDATNVDFAFPSNAGILDLDDGTIDLEGLTTVYVLLEDVNGNTPASGTSASVAGDDVEVEASNLIIPNECRDDGFVGSFTLSPVDATADGDPLTFGELTLTLTQVDGVKYEIPFTVLD